MCACMCIDICLFLSPPTKDCIVLLQFDFGVFFAANVSFANLVINIFYSKVFHVTFCFLGRTTTLRVFMQIRDGMGLDISSSLTSSS